MSDDDKLSESETKLVTVLGQAAKLTLDCAYKASRDNAKWQLLGVAMKLRDRMLGVRGGTVVISPKAIAACIREVEQVSEAAGNPDNGPDFEVVVVEGTQAIQVIDKSDIAKPRE